jgi:hypothetical protein
MKVIASKALSFCKNHYGGNGLKCDVAIAADILWRPTFHFRLTKFDIFAVEVADNLYPEALKGAAYEIAHHSASTISVYQVCSLNVYQADRKQARINLLKKHGVGIITVDDDGTVTMQSQCVPLAQHISSEELDLALDGMNKALKVEFRKAHDTYITNAGQGLQQAGQIVEGIINSIAQQAAKRNVISASQAKGILADTIDVLYNTGPFKNHRASLGAARSFIKEFRNKASHAPKSAKQAAEKIRICRTGFLEAVSVAAKLRTAMQQLGYQVRVYTT